MFYSDEGWSFDRRPNTDAGDEAVIAEIPIEDSRGVFRGQVCQDDIYQGACVYRFGVVLGRFINNLCEIEGIKLRYSNESEALGAVFQSNTLYEWVCFI